MSAVFVDVARHAPIGVDFDIMDLDAEIRAKIQAIMDRKRLSQADISKRSGVHKGTLSSYLRGRTASMSWDRYRAVEIALGEPLLPAASPPPTAEPRADLSAGLAERIGIHSYGIREIPLLDVRLWPRGRTVEQAIQEIRKIAAHRTLSTHPDPQLFAVRATAAIPPRIQPGDELVISPSTPPPHGRLVAVETNLGLEIGEYIETPAGACVRAGASRYLAAFVFVGSVVKVQWDPTQN